jgi:tetratricopeptide (TPR) repeat protein
MTMKHTSLVGCFCALALLCGGSFGDDDTDQQHPQWARLMEEVHEAWSVGDVVGGNEKLLLAVELAKGYTSPVALARSLDLVGGELVSIDPDEAIKVLEEARSIKEAELGPRSAGVADTLMVMAGAVSVRDYSVDEPERHLRSALAVYKEARDIRAEVFGESTCEVGEVEAFIGLMYFSLGKQDKAESMFREILTYCPDEPGTENAGDLAIADLLNLLWEQGRDEEADKIIYARPLEEPKPAPDPMAAAELGPGINDVVISDPDSD